MRIKLSSRKFINPGPPLSVSQLINFLPLTGFTFLNLFCLLECLVMWLISMPVVKA